MLKGKQTERILQLKVVLDEEDNGAVGKGQNVMLFVTFSRALVSKLKSSLGDDITCHFRARNSISREKKKRCH